MTHHYHDYFWKEGIPYGVKPVEDPLKSLYETYKIVMDPYRKHITIEKYFQGDFTGVIYDSAFLNFRHLKNDTTRAWQKTIIHEAPNETVCHLRDQDDRLVFKETYRFEQNLCRECHVTSPHDIPLSIQRMYYKTFKDPFNGVVLFDQNKNPVMCKYYEFDENLNEFTELIETKWDMQNANYHI